MQGGADSRLPPAPALAPRPLQGIAEERQLWRMGVAVNLRGTRVLMPKKRESERERKPMKAE